METKVYIVEHVDGGGFNVYPKGAGSEDIQSVSVVMGDRNLKDMVEEIATGLSKDHNAIASWFEDHDDGEFEVFLQVPVPTYIEGYEKEVQVKSLTNRIKQAVAAYLEKEDLEQQARLADYRLRAAQTKVYEVGGEYAWQILEKGKVVTTNAEGTKHLVLFDHDEYGFVINDVIELTDIELEIY